MIDRAAAVLFPALAAAEYRDQGALSPRLLLPMLPMLLAPSPLP